MHLCLTEGTFLFIHYLVATSMEDMHAPTTLKAFLSLIVDCLPALRTKIRAYMVPLSHNKRRERRRRGRTNNVCE